ncbi:hypothetical protein K788_00003580 [Paraburkholderia caribensis MBA4]|uniref:Uncharacterized protein n=1 Tax=Paraburkholderia caribensis MBA4 TaxID=1323664 RepID=A0A0P0RHR9_9BURK|nr:hypothetical protein K788_00003580 [Paraburkholderia caribensis MBA4]
MYLNGKLACVDDPRRMSFFNESGKLGPGFNFLISTINDIADTIILTGTC